mmetsp:Transcript_411/g.843  ORF Transcript_411/g.843 Transcript_411/m.843 type:complete len:311 (-) Transcript_411:66-998(-)
MGQQCSSDVRRQSSIDEEDLAAGVSPWPMNTDSGNNQTIGGMCGGALDRRMSAEEIDSRPDSIADSSAFADLREDRGPGSGADAEPRAARVLHESRENDDVDDDDEDSITRWAPPCADAEDRVDESQWLSMMATLDQFITPLAQSDGGGGSSGSTAHVDAVTTPFSRRPLGEEAQRDAAFAALQEGRPLYTLPEALRADKEVVLAAIGAEGQYCYDYITSRELRERDRDVVLALVSRDGSLLANCCEELRADRHLVRVALQTCSTALSCAAAQLQGDKELKKLAASRAKEEQRIDKQFEEKTALIACGPR